MNSLKIRELDGTILNLTNFENSTNYQRESA